MIVPRIVRSKSAGWSFESRPHLVRSESRGGQHRVSPKTRKHLNPDSHLEHENMDATTKGTTRAKRCGEVNSQTKQHRNNTFPHMVVERASASASRTTIFGKATATMTRKRVLVGHTRVPDDHSMRLRPSKPNSQDIAGVRKATKIFTDDASLDGSGGDSSPHATHLDKTPLFPSPCFQWDRTTCFQLGHRAALLKQSMSPTLLQISCKRRCTTGIASRASLQRSGSGSTPSPAL